jgi:hypothetical protein
MPSPEDAPAPASLAVDATLYRVGRLAGEPLASGDTVSPGDQLYLELEGSQAMHVYVLDQDRRGATYVLFPLPGDSMTNPLEGRTRHRLPGEVGGARVNWQVDRAGGEEMFLIVASRESVPELDRELRTTKVAESGRRVQVSQPTIETLRSIGGLAEEGDTKGDKIDHLQTLVRQVSASRQRGSEIWMREIRLRNPLP